MIFSQSQGSKGGESKAEALACVAVFSKLKLKAVNHKLTNYKEGSGVVNHVFSEEERSRLPDALRDAPSFATQYAFSVNQVAEEKMTTGEQADLDALLDATLAHGLATDQTFAAE
eukprot:849718-Pleurochrysis_carterae.AAC.1